MGKTKVLTGNYSAAEAAALCRPDLIAAYPITPQSSVVERLASMVNDGDIDSNLVQVESEHSAMSVVQPQLAADVCLRQPARRGWHLCMSRISGCQP